MQNESLSFSDLDLTLNVNTLLSLSSYEISIRYTSDISVQWETTIILGQFRVHQLRTRFRCLGCLAVSAAFTKDVQSLCRNDMMTICAQKRTLIPYPALNYCFFGECWEREDMEWTPPPSPPRSQSYRRSTLVGNEGTTAAASCQPFERLISSQKFSVMMTSIADLKRFVRKKDSRVLSTAESLPFWRMLNSCLEGSCQCYEALKKVKTNSVSISYTVLSKEYPCGQRGNNDRCLGVCWEHELNTCVKDADFDNTLRNSAVYLSLRLFFWLVSLVANVVVFLPSLFHQSFRRDSFKNVLAQLALGDIFLAVGACARHIVNYGGHDHLTLLHCTFLEAFQLTGLIFSQLAMLFISIDRFIAIRKPLFYYMLTDRRVMAYRWVIVVLATVVSSALLFVGTDLSHSVEFCQTSAFWPTWYVVFIYGITIIEVVAVIVLSLTTVLAAQQLTQSERNKKIYYTFIYIIAAYIFLWTVPKLSFLLITKVSHPTPLVSTLQWHVNGIADNILGITNFAIYGWRHREVRRAVVEMFQCRNDVKMVRVIPSLSFHK
ncbi:hypothetical protein QR680_007670 [Steinernema hermaphroditum]|uniref:G-protein coupled receptors family 1 profile domain-containing protein n=1 Tax=Steinernema hermaphroditum TaxID=289476 RepID=A0AA39IFB6_9BILA|nr:hypothetical protein QR680_007670 [Steinernema hermaphroditum]